MKKIILSFLFALFLLVPNAKALEIKLKENQLESILVPIIDKYQDEEGKIKVVPKQSQVDIVKDKILIDVPIKYKFFFEIPLTLKMEYILEDNDLVLAKSKVLFFDQMERFASISRINTSVLTDNRFTDISIEEGYVKLDLFKNILQELPQEEKVPEVKEDKDEVIVIPINPNGINEEEKKEEIIEVPITKPNEKTYEITRSRIVELVSENEAEIISSLDENLGITKIKVNEDESIDITIKNQDITIFGDLFFNEDLDIVYKVDYVKYLFLKVSINDLGKLTSLIGFDIPKGIEQITFCNSYIKPWLDIDSSEVITGILENETGFIVTTSK